MHRALWVVALLCWPLAAFAAAPPPTTLLPPPGVQRDTHGYPIFDPDWLAIRRLLAAGEFEQLDARFAGLQAAFERDFRNEEVVQRGFAAFGDLDAVQSRQVDAWIAARPASAFAQLAAGRRDLGHAWRARGEQVRSQTNDAQLALMRKRAERAREHFERALALDPGLVAAYEAQVMLALPIGDRALAEGALAAALAIEPRLFGVREQYLLGLTRRWGGSREAMDAFAQQAQARAGENPRLAVLLGMSSWDRGRDLHNQSRFADAVAAFDDALGHGPHWRFFSGRAFSHYYAQDYPRALADLDEAEALSPGRPDLMHRRAHVLYFDEQTDAAYRAISAAIALEPSDAHYRSLRSQIQARQRWKAFLANPTPGEAALYAVAWLTRHAGWSLACVFGVWCVAMVWRRSRRRRGPPDGGSSQPSATAAANGLLPTGGLGAAVWRATIWVIALFLAGTALAQRHAFSAMLWIDLGVTLIALAGTLAFMHRRRLLSRRVWQVWAFFPAWVVFVDFHVQGFHLYEWPAWGFVHLIQLPVYAALFVYGYRSKELWDEVEAPYAASIAALAERQEGAREPSV